MKTKPLYAPLADDGEIRLVHLQPGGPDDNVQCLIKHSNLKDNPTYEALSYNWGDPGDGQSLEIDDSSSYQIWPNLRSALYHLRHESEERVIWIDALCINQRDTNERNHQVRQMGRIYKSASKVVVWLGEADETSSAAMSGVSKTNRYTLDGYARMAMRTLCLRPYWERLWIVQEIILAREVLLICGKNAVGWNDFERSIFVNFGLRDHSNNFDLIDRIFESRAHASFSLSMAIKRFGKQRCRDSRDKVFGVLNLVKGCCRDAVPVDYSMELSQILEMVAIHIVSDHLDAYLSEQLDNCQDEHIREGETYEPRIHKAVMVLSTWM